ncbi:hypothetical protein MAR_012320 [Mya arenaria]|uniref:Uncharacterized protein n=1 Tax=Mya arenaria TaxID=6604 RepID=A0ABY7G0U0_MYAAR|nr:hypothetical protein MAR_012318 [Mya arenaria]WAR26616.1 hypothetical protein MAR_012320 [Mya arenaria]
MRIQMSNKMTGLMRLLWRRTQRYPIRQMRSNSLLKAEDTEKDNLQDDRTEATAVEEDAKSEDQLIAEIMREDFLAERKAKARRCLARRCNQDTMDNG